MVRWSVIGALVLAAGVSAQPQFREHVVATGLKGGYQVVPFDMNADGRMDLIALSSGLKDLEWYENPGAGGSEWKRHVIASGFSRMINVVVVDRNTMVLAHEFANEAAKSIGIVSVLRRPAGDGEWTVQEIDRLTTSHRLRMADVRGDGKPVVINAVLTGAKAVPPNYDDAAPLVFYDPAHGFRRELINEANRGVVHGIFVTDWNGDKRDEVLTASFSGIHVHGLGRDGKWTRTEFSAEPTSDVAGGRGRVVAAIEPWHGNRVAIYEGGKRRVIDEGLVDGHTIVMADFDGDGRDEIIAGCRQGPKAVFVYSRSGTEWKREPVDEGGMAAAACTTADLNSDGRPDIACIGSATMNLKWYENVTPKRAAR